MCTLSVVRDADRLWVTMNRDEMHTRDGELPLAARKLANGDAWLGPLDRQAGGTWIGANKHGLVAALLNGYRIEDDQRVQPPSRGQLVPLALAHANTAEVERWLTTSFDPDPYRSFTLVTADRKRTVAYDWDGRQLSLRASVWPHGDAAMYTSSSWAGETVAQLRRQAFLDWLDRRRESPDQLSAFHRLGEGAPQEWTPVMLRHNAGTRSITEIVVQNEQFRGRHWPVERGSIAPAMLADVTVPRD